MADYVLHYWPVPFRGEFVRAVLAHAGKTWSEVEAEEIERLMGEPAAAMPVPFMGPPVLVDPAAGAAVSQMPAIILYLGETLDLLPREAAPRALALKVVNDANDVLDEMTLDGGRQMWTAERWTAFEPRLRKWMGLWEDLGRRHGLTPTGGFLLGEADAGIADVITATLWTTVGDRFARVREMLEATAPMTAALARRVSARPALAALSARSREAYGDAWSGGEIEASLRKVLDA